MGGPSVELFKRLKAKLLAGTLTSGAAAYVWYYYSYVCEIPTLHFHPDSEVSSVVQKHCKSLFERFRPTPWLWLSDAQTLFGIVRTVSISSDFRPPDHYLP
eukprot:jgi/Tetstr1/462781/TSEL_007732.t1